MAPMTISQVPRELLLYIFDFLDEPPASDQRHYDDPAHIPRPVVADDKSARYGTNPHDDHDHDHFRGNLKNASLVCHLWRRCLLPLLFRDVIWRFQRISRPSEREDALNAVEELGFLRFLIRAGLTHSVDNLTIIIDYPESEIGEDAMHHANWGVLPSHCPALDNRVEPGSTPDTLPECHSNDWLWQAIFDNLDLLSINLISSPAILVSLLGRPINLSGAWIFRQRFHILSLSRPAGQRQQVANIDKPTTASPNVPSSNREPTLGTSHCSLFGIRPWNSMLLNEGSSVKVYTTYEYFHHTPPSILPALLDSDDESMQPLLKNTICSFSYIAIFPLASHITNILIPRIPALERFYIQIVPREPSFAEDDYRHPAMDISDLWMERNTAYSQLVVAVFDSPPLGLWNSLRCFESGDAVDREAWEQAVRYVIFAAGATWKVAGEGKFVRRDDATVDSQAAIVLEH